MVQRDGDPLWAELITRKVDGLLGRATIEDDYVYFPDLEGKARIPKRGMSGLPGDIRLDRPGPARPPLGFNHQPPIAHGAALCHRLTDHEPALELARCMSRFLAYQDGEFHPDGRFASWHFHHTTCSLTSILEYALIVDDGSLVDFAVGSFRYARVLGDVVTGYFPETVLGADLADRYPGRRVDTCEICEVADMIVLALKLSPAGKGDYWEDVDRWVRNMFVEGRMLRTDRLDNLPNDPPSERPVRDNERVDHGATRSRGSWGG